MKTLDPLLRDRGLFPAVSGRIEGGLSFSVFGSDQRIEISEVREGLMYSSLISMVEKAKRYADEPDRITIRDLEVDFRGNNGSHRVGLRGDEWHCECDHFRAHGLCAHVMTLQRLFGTHLRDEVRYTAERATA